MNIRKPDVLGGYLRHSEVNNYLDYLGHRFCHFVTVTIIGKSFEKRHLKAIQIHLDKQRKGKSPIVDKNFILIEGGTHGREWITVSVALQCIYQLTERHVCNKDILEKFNFVIVPVVNADGYEYSLLRNRFWRKNRRPLPNSKRIGIDCNRNYDFHWKKSSKTRISYGEEPFSESETTALRNLMQKLSPKLKFYLSLHSFAQTIMYPWGYTKDLPSTWKDLHELAESGKDAIEKSTGRTYRCGSVSNIFHKTYTGSIVDYAYGAQKIPFAIVMELPCSKYGFHPPKDKIRSLAIESWIGIKAMCKKVDEMLKKL